MRAHHPIKPVSGGSGSAQVQPSLTPERWQKIKEIFSLALEREPNQRAAFLDEACAGDESLRSEVESLLTSAESEEAATREVFRAVPSTAAATREAEDPMLGRRVGDYRIERRIGYGGMAAVYLASRADEQFQMRVAVKLLRPDLDHAELLRRFLNERQTLAALDHPHIVKLLDGGSTEESLPYLVMDYVEGVPIDEYCDEHSLSVQQRLRLFCTVCEAVAYAHQHNVIHRDLKPNNILVTRDGKAKLLDFGIAKVLDTSNTLQLATRTANRHLTPAFASPEQVRGDTVAATTDIYSLGVVLYALLTGRRPYRIRECTPAALERAICEQEPESPSTAVDRVETETRPDGTTVTITAESVSRTREGQPEKLRRSLRGDLDTIVMKALQKEPQHRYHSVAELAADIQRHLEHRPILARPATLVYRVSKLLWRHKTEMIAMVAVALILVSAIGFSVWEERSATARARAELVSQRSHGRRSVAVLGFKNLSARSDTAWLSTALSEMLTTELSLGGKLRTIPGENVAQTKLNLSLPETESLSDQTLKHLYKSLGTDFVVLGSYLDTGSSDKGIRLDVNVQDAALGETVASVVETGGESSLPDVVTRTGAALRAKLGISDISPAEAASAQAVLPSNPEAMRLYAEGLDRLRSFDASGARDPLEKATAIDPNFALAHSALGDAWNKLGYPANARAEAKSALDLAGDLPREKNLEVQARYFLTVKQGDKAIETYRTLFNFFPDNLDYGLQLAYAQFSSGKPQDSLQTLELLRKFPAPDGQDPRIDLTEANAVASSDHKREAGAAHRAAVKADALGSRLLAGRARITEARALSDLGGNEQAKAILTQAKQILSALGDGYGEALALKYLAEIFMTENKFEDARQDQEQALQLLQSIGNRAVQSGVLNDLGDVLMRENKISEAEKVYQQALAISRELGSQYYEAVILSNIAILETMEGDLRSAKSNYEEALSIERQIGEQALLAQTLNNLSLVIEEQGDAAEAERMLEDAFGLNSKSGDKRALCESLVNLGNLRLNRYGPGRAKDLFTQALQISKDVKNDMTTGSALSGLAAVSAQEGNLAQAHRYDEEALGVRQRLGDGEYIAQSWIEMAELALDEGSPDKAESLATQAALEFQKQKDSDFEARAKALVVEALVKEGKFAEAQTPISDARTWAVKTQDRETLSIINIADSRFDAAAGNFAQAEKLLGPAIEYAKTGAFGLTEMNARLALGEVELKSGAYKSAGSTLKTLERDARAKGFLLIARKAAEARNAHLPQ
jgi:serine/threonine protein kinase/tetratricopeptide (TPR) repeat protein